MNAAKLYSRDGCYLSSQLKAFRNNTLLSDSKCSGKKWAIFIFKLKANFEEPIAWKTEISLHFGTKISCIHYMSKSIQISLLSSKFSYFKVRSLLTQAFYSTHAASVNSMAKDWEWNGMLEDPHMSLRPDSSPGGVDLQDETWAPLPSWSPCPMPSVS